MTPSTPVPTTMPASTEPPKPPKATAGRLGSRVALWSGAVLAVVLIIFVVRACWAKPLESVVAQRRDLRQTVVSSGQVMAPAEVRVDSFLSSTVQQIYKREGDRVRVGDLLLALDDRELTAALELAGAALLQARAGRRTLRVTTLPEAAEGLKQVQASLLEARNALAREQELFNANVSTLSSLEASRSAFSILQSKETAARLLVHASSAGGSASLTAAAAIALAEAQVVTANVNRGHARVVATVDGVVSARLVEVGEVVRPGTPLLVLTAVGGTRISIEPDERNLALLALGQQATISAEAFPELRFSGTVSYLASNVSPERGTIEVRLDVPKPPAYLRPGMTVSVELNIASKADALALPMTAVQELRTEHPWVGVVGADGKLERRRVKLGLRGDDLVEIASGLAPGERVAYDPPANQLTPSGPSAAASGLASRTESAATKASGRP